MISKVATFITKQLKQKKRLLLKSLFVLLLGFSFLPQQSYFSFNEVYAAESKQATQEQTQKNKLASMDTFMGAISQIAFVLLWPLIALAGLAMDNSLIYGSFMNLDVSLWNVWQIVRSFANYTLGFIFLFGILYWNFSGKTGIKDFKLQDLLKKILLASVLIQASWFIMMALVDLSTILTYSVGGLPLSIVGEDSALSGDDYRMFKMNVDLNLGNYDGDVENNGDTSNAVIYYWNVSTGKYVAPCETAHVKFGDNEEQSFIIGRAFDTFSGNKMLPGYCMYYGSLISFQDFAEEKWSGSGYDNKLDSFKNQIEEHPDIGTMDGLVKAGIVYPVTSGKIPYLSDNNTTPFDGGNVLVSSGFITLGGDKGCGGELVGIVPSKKDGDDWKCLYKESNITVGNIIKKANSMTGPFTALYSSMSNYSNLNTNGLGLWQKFIVTFVNTCFSIMLILPLLALVIVLFVRVGLLWMAIALSPFLVLVTVFDGVIKLPDSLKEYINFGELIKLLLAPVLISFAVGMSLIFMKTLQTSIGTGADGNVNALTGTATQFYDNMSKITGMKVTGSEIDFLGFVKIKLDSTLLNISWLLTMLFGLGITWFLLFWAIKQTSIGKNVGTTLQKLGETALATTPIIPIGQNGLSWRGIKNAPEQVYNELSRDIKARDSERLESLLNIGKTNYSKQVKSFYDNASDFETSFGNNYSDTRSMLGKIDALTKDSRWTSRGADIGMAYNSALENAGTVKNLESIVSNMNSKGGNADITKALEKKEYTVGKDKYQVAYNENTKKYELNPLTEQPSNEQK